MLHRRSTIHIVAWFADQQTANKLNLEPDYQRTDLVWSKDYKAYFIDTIIKDYPAPAIFLHVETSSSGQTTYHVVDGKQRLTAIFEFLEGKFPLSDKYTPQFSGLYFDELPDDVKQNFYQYDLPVQEVVSASQDELRSAFDRLNRNVAGLSKQELRHAAFIGEFAELVEYLADEPFWKDIGISTPATARRMKDVEFVSEIFLLTMKGITDGTNSKKLDEYYAEYESGIPDKDAHLRKYRATIRIFENLGLEFIKYSRFSNLSDFYSLWAAFLNHISQSDNIDYEETRAALRNFEERYAEFTKSPETHRKDFDLIQYYDSARQGVNKSNNRETRMNILETLIKIQK